MASAERQLPEARTKEERSLIETSVPPELAVRVARGFALFRERGEGIERVEAHTYRVPSATGAGAYTVFLDLRCCTCPDHPTAKAKGARCKHFYAAEIFAAKRRAAKRRESAGAA